MNGNKCWNDKLKALQVQLCKRGLDAYLVPSSNEFQNSFAPSWFARLEFLTGFTGSKGSAVITNTKKHYFFTDGRYIEQAKRELPRSFKIINIKDQSFDSWLVSFINLGNVVGYDDKLHTVAYVKALYGKVSSRQFIPVTENLVDKIWHARPNINHGEINLHPIKYSGQSVSAKKKIIVEYLRQQNLDGLIITDLASTAWLLNIRGHAFSFMPCVHCYSFIDRSGKIILFTDSTHKIKKYFHSNDVSVLALRKLETQLKKLSNKRIQLSNQAPQWLWRLLTNPILGEDPCLLPKACKNAAELKGARTACLIDSHVVMKCLAWIRQNKAPIKEMDISNQLLKLRQEEKTFVSPSFPSIVAFKENAALVHYRPSEKSNKRVQGRGLLLIDSGGQYLHGTTDTTRTITIGLPTKEQIHNFTLVLKGHINLITAVFPIGTSGEQLDVLARIHLWREWKDYDHGTGHGVGSFLCVHEGPQNITKKFGSAQLCPGMIVSIEPGFYKPGEYGIRIENLACVVKSKVPGYLSFEVLTYITIDEGLIDFDMLTKQETEWVKSYNKRCYDDYIANSIRK